MDPAIPRPPAIVPPPPPPLAPQPNQPVLGNITIHNDNITEEGSLAQILHWIGFRNDEQREAIIEDCFDSYDSIRLLSENDIGTMASSFAARTVANGRIIFGTSRTKRLKAITHWIQDFYRVSRDPTIVELDEKQFKNALEIALTRANIRKILTEQSSTATSAADSGPLKSEKQWKEWEEKFINYTPCQLGSNGVPLSYIIRENDDPAYDEEYDDFVTRTIQCSPLEGEYFDADKSRKIYYFIN